MSVLKSNAADSSPWLDAPGEAAALVRAFDWSKTPLGPVARWPLSLKTTVATMLRSRHPMFLWWGPELTQIYNDAYVPSFGQGKHPAAMGQKGQACWGEIWPIVFPQIDDVMARGKASWNEDHLVPVWRNGRIEEVYWTYGYSPVLDDAGAIGGTLVVCTETTPRVLAERRLDSLRALAQATASATTVDEIVAAASRALAGNRNDAPFVLLYAPDAVSGQPSLVHAGGLSEAQRDAVDRVCRARLDAGDAPIDLAEGIVGARLPGTPWPEASTTAYAVALRDGRPPRHSGHLVFGLSPRLPFDASYRAYLTQLAEHMAAGLARVESYRAREVTAAERDKLLLHAPVGTAVFRGPDHVFELANEFYCRMVNRYDLVGKTYREAFPELAETELPTVLDRVYRTGEPYSSGEILVRIDKQGNGTLEECFFTFSLEALRDGDKRVYGMMAVAFEITDQVKARRAAERAQSDRESLLRDLETANRTKDEFLAMLGHELRNPLSPIVTALNLIKRREEGTPSSREHEIIERQVAHLVRLVDDLLDVSKITRGKITLRREAVEMAEVVAKAVEIASDLFDQRRHTLTIDLPATGLRVDGDPVRLAQVVANLLTNAARYTEPGGTVSVRAAGEPGGNVVLTVKDNGVGIAPEILPRVFELFVQGQRSTDRKEGGLGLGLALAKSLVAMHGGTLTARSGGAGQGSEFEIRLASTALPAKTREGSRAPSPVPHARSKRVLIVDDSVDAAEMLQDFLAESGFETAVAHDGPSALAIAETFGPDVAVLDIGLPVMDGYELGRRLHESARTAQCRLIALTGYGQEGDRARSKAAGFYAHIVKPVETERLMGAILEESRPDSAPP